jgi:nitrite reductase (NADH) large subunit
MLNSQVSEISVREDGVEGVITNEGKFLNCDMVTYSIGVRPNTDIVKQTNIKINKGIVVNEKMETSVQDIYAAGDIAEVNSRVYGLWNIAIAQGMTAGYNIVGKETRYKYVAPVITMSAFGISLFSMGIIDENENTDVLVEDKEDNNYRKIFIKDNKIIGAIVIGDTKISPILKRAIENEVNIGGIDYKNVYIDEIIETIKNSK